MRKCAPNAITKLCCQPLGSVIHRMKDGRNVNLVMQFHNLHCEEKLKLLCSYLDQEKERFRSVNEKRKLQGKIFHTFMVMGFHGASLFQRPIGVDSIILREHELLSF